MNTLNKQGRRFLVALAFAAFALLPARAADVTPSGDDVTKVVFLGTGYPRPDPRAMGPSLAINVRGHAYIVDAGTGVVRRAAAAFERGEMALSADNLNTVVLTHLHSDHTIGLPDLLFTPWIVGSKAPLTVVGPPASVKMLDHIAQAWDEDIHVRLRGGNTTGYKAMVKEIQEPGKVYQNENVTVTAFKVKHGSWHDAFAFRFDTPDKSIVVSGDTSAVPDVMQKACNGCDILIHEVFAARA